MDILTVVYIFAAVVGGVSFILRTAFQFFMGGGDFGDGDIHTGIADADFDSAHDSDASFKFLSIQGLTAFFMMFGLLGLAMIYQSPFPKFFSIPIAIGGGLSSVWLLAKIFQLAGSFQSKGNIDLANALGKEGIVYLTIPSKGTGQVEISIQNRLRTYDAITQDESSISTGNRVTVVSVSTGDVLVVRRI